MTNEKIATQSLRPVAFAAIVFSTVAITGCLVTFPLVFHYVQTLEASVQEEIDFCKSRSRDMWKEMLDIQTGSNIQGMRLSKAIMAHREAEPRSRRSAESDIQFWMSRLMHEELAKDQPLYAPEDSFVQSFGSCCTCQRGAPGPPGAPGADGADGPSGAYGRLGPRGQPAPVGPDPRSLFPEQCACEAPAGDQGPKGPRGNDGPPGDDGASGDNGKPGDQGPRGPPGNPGPAGQPGQKGPPGPPGVVRPGRGGPPGRPGESGRAGPPGPPGPGGRPGNDGNPGGPGQQGSGGQRGQPGGNGQPGTPGEPGDPGAPGSCDHCPPARLAPGY